MDYNLYLELFLLIALVISFIWIIVIEKKINELLKILENEDEGDKKKNEDA